MMKCVSWTYKKFEFSEYNQQDAKFLRFINFCKTLYMFQTVFPSIRSSKLHIQTVTATWVAVTD